MNEIDIFLKDFYGKYAGETLSDEKLNTIKNTYGDDYSTLISDLYGKYTGGSVDDDKMNLIVTTYNLKKKDTTQSDLEKSTLDSSKSTEPTVSDSKEDPFLESLLEKDEEVAKVDLSKKLLGKGFSVTETGIGDALKIIDNITGEEVDIDLQPVFGIGKGKDIEKLRKLIDSSTDSKRELLSKNQYDDFVNDTEGYFQSLNKFYPGFNFETDGMTATISKDGDVISYVDIRNKSTKDFSELNKVLYDNIKDEDVSKLLDDESKEYDLIQEKIKDIESKVDISMEKSEEDIYDQNYLSKTLEYLEKKGKAIDPELKEKAKDARANKELFKKVLSDQFQNDPEALSMIEDFNNFLTLEKRDESISRAKKLAIENYFETRPDRGALMEIVNKKHKQADDEEKRILANVEQAKKDLKKMYTSIGNDLKDLSEKNPGVKIDFVTDENGVPIDLVSSKKIDGLDQIKQKIIGGIKTFSDFADKSEKDFNTLISNKENIEKIKDASKRNYGALDMFAADVKSGYVNLIGSLVTLAGISQPGTAGVVVGLEGKEMIDKNRETMEEYFKSKRTYDEAIKEGSKFEFSYRTFGEQFANVSLAIASAGAGTSIGLSNVATQAVIATTFGASAAGSKYNEMQNRIEAASKAKQALKDLEKAEGKIPVEKYLNEKYELERATKDLDLSQEQIIGAVITAGVVEGAITRYFGTVPNAFNVLKGLRTGTKDFIRNYYKTNLKAIKDAGISIAKATGQEVIEETSIDFLTQASDYLFLGDAIDISTLDDTAVMAIVTSGGMNVPSTAYGTIMTQVGASRYRSKVSKFADDINKLKNSLKDESLGGVARTLIHNKITENIKKIAEITNEMEADALAVGADGIKDLVMLKNMKDSLLKEAGVKADDTQEVVKAKIDNHLKKQKDNDFRDKLEYVSKKKNEILSDIDYDSAIDKIFGEKGREIADGLDSKLTAKEKFVEVHKNFKKGIQEQIKEEITKEEVVKEPVSTQVSPQTKVETIGELLDRPISLTELGGSKLDTPIEGVMYLDGQQVVVEDENGNITEIGNVDEISEKTLEEMGIKQQMPTVNVQKDENLEIEGKVYNIESGRIKRDNKGNIVSVTIDQVDKPRSKTLRGRDAEDAAYQILLRKAESPEQTQRINEILEQDEEFKNELRKAEDTAKEDAAKDPEQDTREESIASPEVTIEDAPDGTFLNIEMVAGKDGREITQKEILDALPVEPLNVEVSGKTLVIQVPRKLSGSEMMKLAKDTEQDAIPQMSGKKGVLHAQSKEKMDLYGGKFVTNLFVKPKNIIKDERPKPGNRLFNEPLKAVKAIADKYYKRVFKGERPKFKGVKKIDKEFAKRISDAFEAMQDNPNDPEVKAAYEAMAKETMDQYQDFKDAGYTIEINNSEPYKNAQEMIDDLRNNKRMKIFSTESGFGDTPITDKQREENPLLRDSGVKDVNGETLLINDVFRAVHDFYGHSELGNGFGPVGEENAWNVHARMFSPLARRAMTTETRGQNSYVNFSGVNDEAFKLRDEARKLRKEGKEAEAEALVAKVYEIMKFADQKVGLLPEEFSSIEQDEASKVEDEVSKLKEAIKGNLDAQVENARKAIAEALPDVEIVIHDTREDFKKATGDIDRGSFDGKTIHINRQDAIKTTVAHEVFHALFLKNLKSDKQAMDLAERFVKALYPALSAETRKKLDNFAKMYKGKYAWLKNEERLAEFFGMLASEYDTMPKPKQNLVKRFLDRLAKMLGLKPITTTEVSDLLYTLAGKVAKGGKITESELSSIQSNFEYVSEDEGILWGSTPERKQVRTKPDPKKTVKAYKMFRIKKNEPGKLFPLFVKANEEVLMNTWLDAEVGELTKEGKVKSKIGNLAYRPGWHMGDLPIATHIGDKYNFEKGAIDKSLKKPTARSVNHVWAEVEVAADVNWQEEANKRAKKTKSGKIIPRTAQITDRVPSDGYYRYKTNPNMTGEWLIGGSIKVNRVLTDEEVKEINDKAGVADLPRAKPMDLQEFGFDSASKKVATRKQKEALDLVSKDLPKEKVKLDAVADILNSFSKEIVSPDSSEEILISRFLNNIFEESLYTLEKGSRESGLTWYLEDITEFENKAKILIPELKDPEVMKLFKMVLAITSSGTNPNENLKTAYIVWSRSNGAVVDFSKNWGEDKISFIDAKGKSLGSGIIKRELKTKYIVQEVDVFGKPITDKKGRPKIFEARKNNLKEGYPKPTGYTSRGKIVADQLSKIEKVYNMFDGDISKTVDFFETPQDINTLRTLNKSVPDTEGKVNKNPSRGKRNGAFVFGEKIGAFYQNMIGIGETITMDLWWSRTWNRYMGTMISTVSGKKSIQETPRNDRERDIMRKAVKIAAKELNLQVSELQAVIWYFEQELWTKAGNVSPSFSYVTAIDSLNEKINNDEEIQKRFSEAGADLSEADKRRKDAIFRANNIINEKSSRKQLTPGETVIYPGDYSETNEIVVKVLHEDEGVFYYMNHLGSIRSILKSDLKRYKGEPLSSQQNRAAEIVKKLNSLATIDDDINQTKYFIPGMGRGLGRVIMSLYDSTEDSNLDFFENMVDNLSDSLKKIISTALDYGANIMLTHGGFEIIIGGMYDVYNDTIRYYHGDGKTLEFYKTNNETGRGGFIKESSVIGSIKRSAEERGTTGDALTKKGIEKKIQQRERKSKSFLKPMTKSEIYKYERLAPGLDPDISRVLDKKGNMLDIINAFPESNSFYEVVRYMSRNEKLIKNIPVEFQTAKEDMSSGGLYQPYYNVIKISKKANHRIVAHELVHGVTSQAVKKMGIPGIIGGIKGKEYINKLKEKVKDNQTDPAAKKIISLYLETLEKSNLMAKAEKYANDRDAYRRIGGMYGLTNIDEFLAEALTNYKFQTFLNSIQSDKKETLFDKFVKIIGRLIGMSDQSVVKGSILHHTIIAADMVMEKQFELFELDTEFKRKTLDGQLEIFSKSRKQKAGFDIIEKAKTLNVSDAAIRKYFIEEGGLTLEQADELVEDYNEMMRKEGLKREGVRVISNKTLKSLDSVKKFLTSAKAYKPKSMQIGQESRDGFIEANVKKAEFYLRKLNKIAKDEEVLENLELYMRGDKSVDLPDNVAEIAFLMREHIDTLSKQLISLGAVEADESVENIMNNIGSYMTRSYEVFTNKDWKNQVSDQVIQEAKNYLRNEYMEQAEFIAMKENRPVDKVLEEYVDSTVSKLLKKEEAMSYVKMANESKKSLGILKRRGDIPAPLRALMGEYKSPAQNYIISVQKVATLAAQQRFLNEMVEAGKGVWLFEKNKAPEGFRVEIATEGSKTMSPLNGLYTSKEIAEELKGSGLVDPEGIFSKAKPLYDFYQKAVGLVKFNKTILSPGTHAKNFIGNLFFMVANGYIDPKDYYTSTRVVLNDLAEGTNEVLNEKLLEYIDAGIINQSATLRDLKDMMAGKENRVDSQEDFEKRMIERFNKPKNKFGKGVNRVSEIAQNMYQAEDDFFKIVAYEANKQRYAKAYHKKPFEQLNDTQKKEVLDKVKEIVKNTLPNYNRIAEVRRLIRAVPFTGTFISFHMEAIRTAANTLSLTYEELKDPRTRTIGMQRLTGIGVLFALKFTLIPMITNALVGDDDELEKATRRVLPPWSKDSNIIIESVDNGVLRYRDLSASDPWGVVDKVINAARYREDTLDGFVGVIEETLSPFVTEDILFAAIKDATSKTSKSNTTSENIDVVVNAIYKAFSPGALTSAERIFIEDKKSLMDLVAGKTLSYKKDDKTNEIVGQLTGFKSREIKLKDAAFFKFRDIASAGYGKSMPGAARNASGSYSKAWYDYTNKKISKAKLDKSYEESNKKYKEVLETTLADYKAFIKLGLSPREIKEQMKKAGFNQTEIKYISKGYIPNLKKKKR